MTGRGVWRDAAFRRLWAGTVVSKLGTSVAGIATPLIAVQVLDASAFTVSLLTAAAWLPWLLIGLPAGAWADRVAKRPVMLACDLASALVVVSIPVAVWFAHLTVAHLLIVATLVGTASVFFEVAWTAYLPAMFDRDELVDANAILQGSESAAHIAGPAVGGALVAAVSAVVALIVDAASFVISAIGLLLIRRPERRPAAAPARRGVARDIAEGVRWLAREPMLRNLALHGATANLALTGYGAIIVVFLIRDVGVGAGVVGVLMAASGLGGVTAAALVPRLARRYGAARVMVRCKVGGGLASLLIPLTGPGRGLAAFVLGAGLVAACVVAGNVVADSFRQAYVPPRLLGRVVTAMQFVNLGAIPLGAVLGGAAATAVGTRGAVAMMTAVFAVSGLILLLGPWRGRRDLPAPAGDGPGAEDRRAAGGGEPARPVTGRQSR